MTERDIKLHIVGEDDTGRATRSAERNLDRLERKTREFDKSSKAVRSTTEAFVGMASTLRAGGPYLAVAAIAAAIQALPAIAALAGAGIVLGLGGGLVAIGIMAAAKNAEVRRAFSATGKHIAAEVAKWGQFFVPVLLHISQLVKSTFDAFAPTIRTSLAAVAPQVQKFADQVARALLQLQPAIQPLMVAFGRLLDEIGPRLPVIGRTMANALIMVSDAVADNADEIAELISIVLRMIGALAALIAMLTRIYGAWRRSVSAVYGAGGVVRTVAGWFAAAASRIGSAMSSAASAVFRAVGTIKAAINSIPLVRIIRIAVDTGAIGAAVSRARSLLSALPGFSGGNTLTARAPQFATAGPSFSGAPVGGAVNITTGPTNVDARVFLDGREIAAVARTVVQDENSRAAFRARYGRRVMAQ